jgi:hypothetical protein
MFLPFQTSFKGYVEKERRRSKLWEYSTSISLINLRQPCGKGLIRINNETLTISEAKR